MFQIPFRDRFICRKFGRFFTLDKKLLLFIIYKKNRELAPILILFAEWIARGARKYGPILFRIGLLFFAGSHGLLGLHSAKWN